LRDDGNASDDAATIEVPSVLATDEAVDRKHDVLSLDLATVAEGDIWQQLQDEMLAIVRATCDTRESLFAVIAQERSPKIRVDLVERNRGDILGDERKLKAPSENGLK